MKKLILVTILSALLFNCKKEKPKSGITNEPYLTATVNNKTIVFGKPRILIQMRHGQPWFQRIIGYNSTTGSITGEFYITFGGELVVNNSNESYSTISSTYSKDDYTKSWSSNPFTPNINISSIISNKYMVLPKTFTLKTT